MSPLFGWFTGDSDFHRPGQRKTVEPERTNERTNEIDDRTIDHKNALYMLLRVSPQGEAIPDEAIFSRRSSKAFIHRRDERRNVVLQGRRAAVGVPVMG